MVLLAILGRQEARQRGLYLGVLYLILGKLHVSSKLLHSYPQW